MPLSHHLPAHASYEPPALEAAGDVFDELWAVVETGVGPDANQVDLAQEQLAQFVLALVAEGTTDRAELMRRAAGMLQDALNAATLNQ